MSAAQKLSHLLQLADEGPSLRAALAEEVTELLTDWPQDYPESMREICETLLAKAARDVDQPTRARLRVRLYSDPDLAHRVLPRESAGHQLVETARQNGDLVGTLAENLAIEPQVAVQILDDESGVSLALACKGAHLHRSVFSALAVLTWPYRDRIHAFAMLDTFDTVPLSEATRVLRGWRENQAAA